MLECPAEESILCFVNGVMDDTERAVIAPHLGDCGACAAVIAQLVRDATTSTSTPTEDAAAVGVDIAPPERISHYRVVERIGAGGMGEVWCAIDDRLGRDVAIKVMRKGRHDPNAIARFLREARVQGRLEHPSIVPVHDVGDIASTPFFVMKRLSGTTLEQVRLVLARGDREAIERWPRRTLLARLVDVCLAVELAHQRGVIHRDLKPANIMLGEFGETYVLDWGLARVADTAEIDAVESGDRLGDLDSGGRTMAGTILGTPGYMSPEQMRGESIDFRADVYALGCILVEILTGVPAVPRDRLIEVTLEAPCHRPSLVRPDSDTPPELDDVCARATAADPRARHPSARALADQIQRFLDGDRDLVRRRELGNAHAERALEMLAFDDAKHPEAMREAARAIALDPTNRVAQNVLARLLLEPPRDVPPEARRRIDDERQRNGRQMLSAGAWVYLGFLVLLPIFKLVGVVATMPFVITAMLVAALAVACALAARGSRPLGIPLLTSYITLHCSTQIALGIFMGPLLILPMLVVGSLAVMLVMPSVNAPKRIFAFHLVGIATPLVLEWIGAVPSTYHVVSGTLVIHPWAVSLSSQSLIVAVLATLVVNMVGVTAISVSHRKDQEYAQERVHVQSWHLAQLVPEAGYVPVSESPG